MSLPKRSRETLAFVLQHPASSWETKRAAARLVAEVESRLPAQVVVDTRERSKSMKLEEVVAAIR